MAQTNEITVGISITTTGPAAALGIPERNSLDFVPKEIGGVPIKIITLDDGGDPTTATTNTRRFVTESKADIIMGSSTTPSTVAVSTVANEAGIPHIGLGAVPDQRSARQVVGRDAAADSDHGQGAVRAHEGARHQVRRLYRLLRFLRRSLVQRLQGPGFTDGNDARHRGAFARAGYVGRRTGSEAARRQSDAILVGASGTAAALPQTTLRERGYKGLIYQTHGAASMDFIRIAGPAAEGVIMASGPVMSPETQPTAR
jgi:branched-chain amino acid transport system substrate-binding protein